MNRLFLALAAIPTLYLATAIAGAAEAPAKQAGSMTPIFRVAEKGVSRAVVVVSPTATKPVLHAAAELVDFLGQVTGARFETSGALQPGKLNIAVGEGAAKLVDPKFTVQGLGMDGMVIRTYGTNLILAGGETRGTLYAVYSFLEDTVGCHWWSAKASTIPQKPDLSFGRLDRRYIPPFEHREILIAPNTNDADWSVRNKCVGELHGYGKYDIMDERGGTRKQHPPGHSYFYVLPPDKYFATHPEWYSEIEGVRQAAPTIHASLCLTNPAMRAEFAKNLVTEIRNAPDMYKAAAPFYAGWIEDTPRPFVFAAVSAPDDSGYPSHCQCPVCLAAEKKLGGPSGLTMDFVNEMARAVKVAYPEMLVTTFAYHYNQLPPTGMKMEDNVVVYFCPIHMSYAKPITDPRNQRWLDDFKGWLKISRRVYLYDYPDNVSYEQVPHPDYGVLAENLRWAAKNGVKGYFGDGMNGGTVGSEMAELRAWFIAKLLWDPTQDPEALIATFTDGYYGAGGKDVAAYIKDMTKALDVSGDWLGLSTLPTDSFLSFENLVTALHHLEAAEAKVKNDPVLLARVQIAQLPVRFVILTRWYEFKELAEGRNLPWPVQDSRDDAYAAFKKVMDDNGIAPNYSTATELNKLGKVTALRD